VNAALGVGIWGLATLVLLVAAGASLWRHSRDRATLADWLAAAAPDRSAEVRQAPTTSPGPARDTGCRVG